MQTQEGNPIIFIPGLMGSMGNDIIEGTGNWSFGAARWVYDPLIRQLEKVGYVVNENLFICYYDWRKKNSSIVEAYLKPMIRDVKEKHSNKKIDLICHSMGGIVARTYIQSTHYQFDINRFVMIGTPNEGSVEAYYLWSTGRLLPKKEGSNFFSLISKGYMWILLRLMKVSFGLENLKKIHETFPSVRDLIPTERYGSILCYENGNGKWEMVPRYYMAYENRFLDELNDNLYLLSHRLNDVYCIAGYNFSTAEYLMIDKEKLFEKSEEIIIDSVETLDGDGTVAVKSAAIEGLQHYYIEANHRRMVERCFSYIKDIYDFKTEEDLQESVESEDITLHIIFTGKPNIIIYREKSADIELNEGQINTNYSYIYEKFPEEHKWIIIQNIPKGIYSIKVDNYQPKNLHLMVMSENLKELDAEQEIKAYQKDYIYKFEIY